MRTSLFDKVAKDHLQPIPVHPTPSRFFCCDLLVSLQNISSFFFFFVTEHFPRMISFTIAIYLYDFSRTSKLIPQTPLLPGGVLVLPRLLLPRPGLPVLPFSWPRLPILPLLSASLLPFSSPTIPRLPVGQQLLRHVRLGKGGDYLAKMCL